MKNAKFADSKQSRCVFGMVVLIIPILFSLLVLGGTGVAQIRPRPIAIDVHVHTSAKHYALLDDILSSYGVTRFINLSGGQPGNGLERIIGHREAIRGPREDMCDPAMASN